MKSSNRPDEGDSGRARLRAVPEKGEKPLHRSEHVTATEYSDELAASRESGGQKIALQVHLPFCPTRCFNCKSNVTITHDPGVIDS